MKGVKAVKLGKYLLVLSVGFFTFQSNICLANPLSNGSCMAFLCMAGELQGSHGGDCEAGRQSFYSKRVFSPFYNPPATAQLRNQFLSTCPSASYGQNRAILAGIIEHYGMVFSG